MPTWNSLKPMLRPNRPTVANTVALAIVMANTANKTHELDTAAVSARAGPT